MRVNIVSGITLVETGSNERVKSSSFGSNIKKQIFKEATANADVKML
jgi:hypothetical protein